MATRRAVDAVTAYEEITDGGRRYLRCTELVYEAAERFPGLVPTRREIERERTYLQKEKRGLEIAQGDFFSRVLANRATGLHLIEAMGRPRQEAMDQLAELRSGGRVDLGSALIERRGNVGWITLKNLAFLNAEDDASTAAMETAVDLVLLDPQIEVGILRGAPMTHPKHAGRRIFGSGINLTHLYQGRISLVEFMLERELGCVNKMFRGLSPTQPRAEGSEDDPIEKPFLAAVESWAIGGACQWLLVMDAVVAERSSFFNLPARKEGIIPGCANLRLPRFVGERLAREAIFLNLEFQAGSAEGRLIADRVVDADEIESEVTRLAQDLTAAGPTSLVANRRALRAAHEPLDVFRQYLATYAIAQAKCLYSPALIQNLERNWDAARRMPDARSR
ncbi:MAG: enoyl-CoA hydratase/isomerase family protein [Candidatus Dormibacterales bacterium]